MSGTAKENERAQNAKPPEAFSGRFREADSVVQPDNDGDATGRANDDRLQTELAGSKIDAASAAAPSKDERSTTKDLSLSKQTEASLAVSDHDKWWFADGRPRGSWQIRVLSFGSFLGETDGPFLGADLRGWAPGAQLGSRRPAPQAWMP